jgi:hypothetical protein
MPAIKPSLWLHPARLTAERDGRVTFDPGYPCVRGHHAERYVGGDSGCVECSRINAGRAKQRREANPNIVTRERAQKLKLKSYNTGTPCARGHHGKRFTLTARCVKCAQAGLYVVNGPEAEALQEQIADLNAARRQREFIAQ